MAVPVTAPEEPGARPPGSRQWGKYLPWIVAAVVVIVVVGIIRLTSSKSPDALTPTTVTTTTAAPNSSTTTSAAGSAVSTNKTAYLTAANQMDVANAAATHGLAGAANTSVPQVTAVMTQYQKGLQTFVFAVHRLHWTGTTLASSDQLTMEIQTMVTYLSTVSTLNTTNLHPWLNRFNLLATSIQTADNTVRGQLGIPTTRSYP